MNSRRLLPLAVLAILVPALLVVASGVRAQSMDPVLVSNTGQTARADLVTASGRVSYAQSFTTGSHVDGYFLTSVDVGLKAGTGVTVTVSLWASSRARLASDFGFAEFPGFALTTLTAPASIDDDSSTLERFSINDVLLLPDTTYWIVVEKTGGAADGLSVAATSSGSEDDGGMSGFSLDDWTWVGPSGDGWDNGAGYGDRVEASMKTALRGSEATRPPGPYQTNRNRQPWAEHAETGTAVIKYATLFTTNDFGVPLAGGQVSPTYDLTSVLLSVAAETGVTPRVAIHANENGSPASSALPNGTLTTPTGISHTLGSPTRAEFTAAQAITLNRGTSYWVVVDVGSGSGNLSVGTTSSDDQDFVLIGKTRDNREWSIGNTMKAYNGTSWSNDSTGRSFRMALNGTTDIWPGSIKFGLPQVGIGIPVEIVDDSGRIKNESWQWQRGDTSDGTFTDIPVAEGGTLRSYVPSADDLGKWLKATVTYADAMGPDKSASAVSRQPVHSRPAFSNISQEGGDVTFIVAGTVNPIVSAAQAFTTGNNPSGYVLSELRIPFGITSVEDLSWALHANVGNSPPGQPNFDNDDHSTPAETPLFDYIAVPTLGLDSDPYTVRQLPHPGFLLSPNTKYWVVLKASTTTEGAEPGLGFIIHSEQAHHLLIDGPAAYLDPGSESGWTLDLPPLSLLDDRWNLFINDVGWEGKATLRMSVVTDPVVTATFEESAYTVAEGDDTTTSAITENRVTVTVKLNADPERTVVIPITATGQDGATSADYSVPSSVTFNPGETEKTVVFTATDDTVDDDGESVTLSFGTLPVGVDAGTTTETTVSITDDDDPHVTASFEQASYSVDESDDTTTSGMTENQVTVTVKLNADPERTVVIPITATGQGGATGADYSLPSSVTFNSGDTEKTIVFSATHDTVDDDGESVRLSFGNVLPPRVTVGSPGETTVTITDDDDPHVAVSFEANAYTVPEGGMVTVTVELDADPERSVTVPMSVAPRNGATPGDYSVTPDPLSVTFAVGETEKTITFTAVQDTLYERGESLLVSFDTLPDRVTTGPNDTTTIWIEDDDPRPVAVTFGESTYWVGEGGNVAVSVQLDVDPERTVVVPITTTHQGGATTADYSGVPASVTFASGDTEKFFTVAAVDDEISEKDPVEMIELGFGALPDAVTGGTPATTTITFSDQPCPGVVWCGSGTLELVSEDPANGRRVLRSTTEPLAERLKTGKFTHNGVEYFFPGLNTLKHGPSGTRTAAPPFHIPERASVVISLQQVSPGATAERWTMPNDDWKDWTLKISAVIGGETTEIDLPFSEAQFCCNNLWKWFGLDLHDLVTSWSVGQQYDMRIVSDPRASRAASPPGKPLHVRTAPVPGGGWAVASRSAVITWVRPQLRNDGPPDEVTYKLQWKLRSSSWDAPDDVTEHTYTPDEGDQAFGYTITGLTPDTGYHVRAITVDKNDNEGEPSESWPFRTRPSPAESNQMFSVGILGSGRVGDTLTATVRARQENVDLDDYTQTHQWLRAGPGTSTATAIAGATGSSYVVGADDEGHRISVRVTFTDEDNNQETAVSVGLRIGSGPGGDEQSAQQQAPNSPATGVPGVTGSARTGETLTADTSGIADPDGLTNPVFSYQWVRDDLGPLPDEDIAGETGRTYTVTSADEGNALKLRVSFTDDAGNPESLVSNTYVVSPPLVPSEQQQEDDENSPATGEPYATGTAEVGHTLIAEIYDIADEDGLTNASYAYQWVRWDPVAASGTDIDGETGETYTVTADDVGSALRIRVSFTDDAGNDESLTSEPTTAVIAAPEPELALSDLDVGAGQQVQAGALVRVGDRGRKDDDTRDRAWYATDTPAWRPSGELRDGALSWNGITLTRVAYFADTGILRFNEADPNFHLGDSFASGGVNYDLTIWVQAESGVVSFLASDHIANSGGGWVNFDVPQADRPALAAIAKDDLIIVAVSAPHTS